MNLPGQKAYRREWLIKGTTWSMDFKRIIDGDKDILGICDPINKQITIRMCQTRHAILTTFIHEIIHTFEFEYGFPIPHKLVYELENAIADFLIHNF